MNRKRIGTVLRVRELQERLARQQVVQARHELTRRVQDERDARAEVDARSVHCGTTTRPELLNRRHMLRSGVEHTVRLAGHVIGAEAGVDQAMTQWRDVAQRLDGVERLAERVAEHDRAEALREEAALIDDLVIARWGRTDDGRPEVPR